MTNGFVGSVAKTTLTDQTYPYVNSATKKLFYASATDIFTNVNSDICGAMTGCEVLPSGCTGTYTGKLAITSAGELSAT